MNSSEIEKRVKEVIIRELELGSEYSAERMDDDFLVTFNINSIDALTILLQIENEFDIEIDDDHLNAQELASINNIKDLVKSLVN